MPQHPSRRPAPIQEPVEFISQDDLAMLAFVKREAEAAQPAIAAYQALIRRLWDEYELGETDQIVDGGRIVRGGAQAPSQPIEEMDLTALTPGDSALRDFVPGHRPTPLPSRQQRRRAERERKQQA